MKIFRIVFGELTKPIESRNYFSAFLKGEGIEIDEKTFVTHDCIGDAEQCAGLRQLSHLKLGHQVEVSRVKLKVVR